MIRQAVAWLLYGLGHGWSVVFDRWLPCGLWGPLYRTYNALMLASERVQDDGPGPWEDPA